MQAHDIMHSWTYLTYINSTMLISTHPLVTPPIQQRLDQTVSSLRRAAEQPKICVVSDFDEMLEPLAEKCRVGSGEFVKALATFHDG